MKVTKTKHLTATQSQQINQLWNDEYPLKLKDRFGLLLEGVENYNHYIIADDDEKVIAWAVDFEKDNETRFSIIVSKTYQGKGLGKALINKLREDLQEFYGWVIDHDNDKKENGENYHSPLMFYVKQGFEVLPHTRIHTDLIKAVKIKRAFEKKNK